MQETFDYCQFCHLVIAKSDPEKIPYKGKWAHFSCRKKDLKKAIEMILRRRYAIG